MSAQKKTKANLSTDEGPKGLYLEPRYPEFVSQKLLTIVRVIFLIPHLILWLWILINQPFYY